MSAWCDWEMRLLNTRYANMAADQVQEEIDGRSMYSDDDRKLVSMYVWGTLVSEDYWAKKGRKRTYYVYPAASVQLQNTPLDVDWEHVRPPIESFSISFQENHGPLIGHDKRVSSVLVGYYDGQEPLDGNFQMGHKGFFVGYQLQAPPRGDRARSGSLFHLNQIRGKFNSVENSLACIDHQMIVNGTSLSGLVRVVLGTMMLATRAHRWVCPYVLSGLVDEYMETEDKGRKKHIEEKSMRRRGRDAFSVGRFTPFIDIDSYKRHEKECRAEGGSGIRELYWQHLRQGYWRYRRDENGERVGQPSFVEWTIVRPDLPVNPDAARVKCYA